ncbi:MAG: lamin tail domain-containing protein [Sphingobacteriales bacterium]|nr:lamin tail domain-containing protein [Sphingobacteriales bacterium]
MYSGSTFFPNSKTLLLTLSEPLQNSIIYTININGGIYDCTGNALTTAVAQFAIPSPIEANDVVINEILFNPATGNVDFVELYNRSNKVIDLSSLYIANGVIVFEQLAMDDAELIGGDSYLLFPQEYVVLTTDPALVKQQYNTPNPDHFIQVSLPSYNDDAGIVILSTNQGIFIDWVAYFSSWHYALLDDLNGVSLERISSEATSNSRSNWHSAASSVGYATPAYQNSQKFIGDLNNDDRFTLSENAFSPDGDSNKDYLLLNYEMPEAGYTANITIFDAAGREVRRLVQNDLLAVKGFYQWDGTLSNGEKAGVGMYVVVLETFNLKGDSETFKKAVALTGNLD